MSKKKVSHQDLNFELSLMMVPRDFLDFFEVYEVKNLSNEWQLILHEKEHLIPQVLKDKEAVVLDGFCNPLQILSHCFSLKPVYLIIKRRRWKYSNTNEHYSNEYELTKNSAKLTPDMANFLKI
jgi:hypothetical protein